MKLLATAVIVSLSFANQNAVAQVFPQLRQIKSAGMMGMLWEAADLALASWNGQEAEAAVDNEVRATPDLLKHKAKMRVLPAGAHGRYQLTLENLSGGECRDAVQFAATYSDQFAEVEVDGKPVSNFSSTDCGSNSTVSVRRL